MKILVTGGAGFIGQSLARRLLAKGHEVTIFDNLLSQVHGTGPTIADAATLVGEFVRGDVSDRAHFHEHLSGKDIVVHLAAETGTGQSMYDVLRYERTNVHGTSLLMDFLVNDKRSRVQRLVVASSRAVYGEGKYRCAIHGVVYPESRVAAKLDQGRFDPECRECGQALASVPTDETSQVFPTSYYGVTKYMQESTVLLFARALGLDAFALRYQNVYGPGQSLINPYTGILAIFSGLAKAGAPIEVFEDGLESRDFVFIDDVVSATARCVDSEIRGVACMNIGSGVATSVMEVARRINAYFGNRSSISVSGAYRLGDIRHNVAALDRAKELIGFSPTTEFEAGLSRFLDWSSGSDQSNTSGYRESLAEMERAGLFMRPAP